MKNLVTAIIAIIWTFGIATAYADNNTIYIYNDEGVGPGSLAQTLSTFKNVQNKYAVKTLNTEQVKTGTWTQNAILFIMPGGADLPYVKKLNGQGNQIIKQYVKNGGSFLGICAGSYYGSSFVEFDKNGSLEVLGSRELGFFTGKAIGPILAPYDYMTESGTRAAKVHTIWDDVKDTVVFYNGGGFFEHAEKAPNTKVIGTYENNLPAIILINYDQGKVVLSGVHFEYNPSSLDSENPYMQKILPSLNAHNESRKILINHLLETLGAK